jgi:outer membrane protein OmpA-like peptidoglycan-associated protein
VGHTDATGAPERNLKLSQDRAAAVVVFLEAQGIAAGRLESFGYGQDRPVAENDTRAGRGKNRRVEIVLTEG